MDVEIKVNKNAEREVMEALKKGLRMIGMKAESYAKSLSPVDTGLLRNSITFAIGGELTHIGEYADNNGENREAYQSPAPSDENGTITLYVGTNVHYAIYQELGHMTTKGNWIDPQPFLRPALENHADEYKQIIIGALNAIR